MIVSLTAEGVFAVGVGGRGHAILAAVFLVTHEAICRQSIDKGTDIDKGSGHTSRHT